MIGTSAALLGSALAGSGGSLLGGWLGNKKSSQEKQALDAQTALQRQQAQALQQGQEYASGTVAPQAANLLTSGTSALTPSVDYWTRLLSGNQQEMNRAIAPEAARISAGYSQAQRSAAALNPRGGYRNSTLADLPFQKTAEINNLFSTLRPAAANNLASVGTNLMNMGSGLTGTALGGLIGAGSGAGSTGSSLLSYGLGSNAQGFDMSRAIGSGLYDLMKLLGGSSGGGGKPSSTGNLSGYFNSMGIK